MAKSKRPTDLKELKAILEQVSPDRKPIADSLYRELEFMQKTLEVLKVTVESDGVVRLFKQGKQEFMQESAALKSYTNLMSKYSAIYKQVEGLLPKQDAGSADSALREFLKQG